MKYQKIFKERFREYPTFTIKDASVLLESLGSTKAYVNTLIHNLIKSGEIKKITKGSYTFHDDVVVIGFGFSPFYYGLQDALSWHNIWEQEVNPVIITPRKVRSGVRAFLGRNYLIRRIERRMFFGFDSMRRDPFWIPVSNPEKTLIDFIYFKEDIPRAALDELLSIIRKDVLEEYLKRIPSFVAHHVMSIFP
jgi:predicted transcriptional regulator of viral defense system